MGITEKMIKNGSKKKRNLLSGITAITINIDAIDNKIKIQLALM
jgi:hypothetical protein